MCYSLTPDDDIAMQSTDLSVQLFGLQKQQGTEQDAPESPQQSASISEQSSESRLLRWLRARVNCAPCNPLELLQLYLQRMKRAIR